MGDYQGSQGFAQVTGGNESVNRNTGSLNYSLPLFQLRGVVEAVGLTLSLSYSAGTVKNLGLPQNWTFGIPYVIPNKSVTTQSRTYVIDNQWADSTGYKSGLRYINNHGMLFKIQSPAIPLPSGNPGQYGWSFRYTDGSVDYFDPAGKLIEHDDIYGNCIFYTYKDSGASPQDALLLSIQDSWKQKITFQYSGNLTSVTGPNNDLVTISFGTPGVSKVEFPVEGYDTYFYYIQVASKTVLQSIRHGSGLQSAFRYRTLQYLDSSSQQQLLPAVQFHQRLDADNNILSQTNYQFGTATSGQTFTGYALHKQMGGGSDGLMDSGSSAYQYDTLILNFDGENSLISGSRVTFNYLHLPVLEDHYAVDGGGQIANTFRAVNKYLIDPNLHARTANYTSPSEVEQLNWNPSTSGWQSLRHAKSISDNFGCVTYEEQSLWDAKQADYILQQSKSCTYTQTSWGGQMLLTETYQDALTGCTKHLAYSLTSDQKSVASVATSYEPSNIYQLALWKVKSSKYDRQGRIIEEMVAWDDSVQAPAGSVQSYRNTNEYSYDNLTKHLTLTAIDPEGKATISKYDTKVRTGPLVEKSLAMGQTETFTYDLVGRPLTQTDAMGNITSYTYKVGPGENSVLSVASNGYCLKHLLDVLGRRVQLLDNGNSSESSPSEPTRTVYKRTYDSMSRLVSDTDAAGLATTYNAYDAFNRLLSSTDPDGNVTTTVFDDVNFQQIGYVNGAQRTKVQLDGFRRKIWTSKYADDSDSSIDYCITETNEYNGFGTITKVEHYQDALNGRSRLLLDTTTRTLDVEDSAQTESITTKSDAAGDAYDTVKRTYARDIFGLIYTHEKTTNYSDGRSFTHNGQINIYNNCKLLVLHQNELGQKEEYTYDDNGWKTSTTGFDGSIYTYSCDNLGRILTSQDPQEIETRTYLSNDRLASISTQSRDSSNANTVKYSYTLDGSANAVTYPNNQINSYGLDPVGRIISQTDVHGVQRQVVFNAQSRVATRSIGDDVVSYTYGTANHTHGQLLQTITSGSEKQVRTVDYDGYSRPNKIAVTDSRTSALLLSSSYQFNSQSKLQQIVMSSSLPNAKELNCIKKYAYDGFGQLISEVISYSDGTSDTYSFTYDGNCNMLSKTCNGATEERRYNLIGQRTDQGFTYDAAGRMLTDNVGRKYTYSADDRLLSVNGVEFTYHPDGSMASSSNITNDEKALLYYDGGAVNAAETEIGRVSYQLEPERRLASYDPVSTKPLSYFIENNGSTVLSVSSDVTVVDGYGAYGNSTDDNGDPNQASQFGYRQEYADPTTGIVYLRARFYNPDIAAFITMDPTHKENRYAYCGGDPINRYDPSGHSGAGAMAAGMIVGFAVTAAVGFFTGGALASVYGASCIAASVASAAIAGSAGSVAGDVVGPGKISVAGLALDVVTGAIGGVVGAGSGGGPARLVESIADPLIQNTHLVCAIGAGVSTIVGGAVGSMTGVAQNILTGRPAFGNDSAIDFLTGAISGIGGAIHMSMSYLPLEMKCKVSPVLLKNCSRISMETWIERDPVDDGPSSAANAKVMKSFVLPAERRDLIAGLACEGRPKNDVLKLNGRSQTMDTILIHGAGGDVFPAVRRTINGTTELVYAPMKGRAFAAGTLRGMKNAGEFGHNGDIKVLSCHGSFSNAKDFARALGQRVFATRKSIHGLELNTNWNFETP